MSETEIKFVTRESALPAFIDKVLPVFERAGYTVNREAEMRLQNDYYDTAEYVFQNAKMGFRVRGFDEQLEQTMKTQGKISGGLHQRAEYNVPLESAEPDLRLFPKDVWPAEWDVDAVNDSLQRQFSTNFVRTTFNVEWQEALVEIVVDEGEATTGKNSSPIHEIELELKKGKVADLFTLSQLIIENMPVRLSDVSKAAQGYQLLNGLSPVISPMQHYLALEQGTSTEEAFYKAIQSALSHWQKHEHLFYETGSVKMLSEIVKSIRLLLQTVTLYLPVLQCPQLMSVHQLLTRYIQGWLWQDDLQSLRYLLSKKSLFNKCLSRYPALLSYLQGRKAGLIHAHHPEDILFGKQTNRLKLLLSQILHEKPWREHSRAYDVPVMEHAQGWLAQGWQTVQQTMPAARTMTPENYLAIGVLLRQTLWNGYLLADLFDEDRHHFRAPWLDIITGIDELKALMMLKAMSHESELDDVAEVYNWIDDKIISLMHVMERTRQAGMQGDIYW